MALAVPVSIYEVAMQLEYFSRPKLQIRVIRILWMVPIYALDSWLALRFEVRPCLPDFLSCSHAHCCRQYSDAPLISAAPLLCC